MRLWVSPAKENAVFLNLAQHRLQILGGMRNPSRAGLALGTRQGCGSPQEPQVSTCCSGLSSRAGNINRTEIWVSKTDLN